MKQRFQVKTKINGNLWTVELVSSKQMKKERADGEHLAGLCIPDDRRILVAEDCLNYKTVSHELYHAYFSDLHLSDTNSISLDDLEEIAAAMFADKGEEMVKKSKSVFKRLEKGK